MPQEIINFILHYGYLAIFILIFSQEIGIPNPVPNELVLVFSGYLCFQKILVFPLVILTSFSADFIGTGILYVVFYFFGTYIIKHKPRWFPISDRKIEILCSRFAEGGLWTLYLGRITPLIRGYTSVIAGLLQVKPILFVPIAATTAFVWSCLYVIAGLLIGPSWEKIPVHINLWEIILFLVVVVLAVKLFRKYFKKKGQPESEKESQT
ncbi:MAG: DedA family protein [Saprospiraceae bacterium]